MYYPFICYWIQFSNFCKYFLHLCLWETLVCSFLVMSLVCVHFASWIYSNIFHKFGKLSSGHRTGKGQFSFQSQRTVMPKNVQTSKDWTRKKQKLWTSQLQTLKFKLWSKISKKTKAQGQTASQENSIKHLEKSQCLFFWNSSKKLQRKEHFKLTLWGHTHSDSKTRQRQHKKENYRPISLRNIDAKTLNTILLLLLLLSRFSSVQLCATP